MPHAKGLPQVQARTDVDEAQARLDMTVAQELEARQSMEFTRHRIAVLTGQPVEGLAKLDVERFMPMGPVPASVDDWIGQAEPKAARAAVAARTTGDCAPGNRKGPGRASADARRRGAMGADQQR